MTSLAAVDLLCLPGGCTLAPNPRRPTPWLCARFWPWPSWVERRCGSWLSLSSTGARHGARLTPGCHTSPPSRVCALTAPALASLRAHASRCSSSRPMMPCRPQLTLSSTCPSSSCLPRCTACRPSPHLHGHTAPPRHDAAGRQRHVPAALRCPTSPFPHDAYQMLVEKFEPGVATPSSSPTEKSSCQHVKVIIPPILVLAIAPSLHPWVR